MFKHAFRIFVLPILTIFLLGIILTGCGQTQTAAPTESNAVSSQKTPSSQQPSASVSSSDSNSSQTNPQSKNLTLYFPNSDGTGLAATNRTATIYNSEVIKAIFQELATPPSGLEKPLPEGTTLLSASVSSDGVATINLSKEFQKNFKGGSTGEEMTIYSIVNSLTTLSNVNSVQFLLEGKKMDAILGGLATDTPLKPNTSLNVKK